MEKVHVDGLEHFQSESALKVWKECVQSSYEEKRDLWSVLISWGNFYYMGIIYN